MVLTRGVYRYKKSIGYVSTIHCFDTRYVSSMLICSYHQDKHFPVLMTGPLEPHFNMCTTLQDSPSAKWHPESVCSGLGSLIWSKH